VLTGGPGGVSDRWGGRTNRAGPALGNTGADRWARGAGHRARSGIRDLGRAIKIGRRGQPGGSEQLRAVPLHSAAVRSPELRQARARVAPGSPGLGREGENATTNSVEGKRPRICGQRGKNDGEEASGGPEELR
jgi:hypothetical protein